MEKFLNEQLAEIKSKGLFRQLRDIDSANGKYISVNGNKYIDFSSNNYLGLRDNPEVKTAAINAVLTYGAGSGASRIVSGTSSIYKKLEEELSIWKQKERTLLFNSGYDANLATISALFSSLDVVFSDELNHASIIDGILSSKARLITYSHNDIGDLKAKLEKYRTKYRHALVVTDSVFSMDGDTADIKNIAALKSSYDFILMVDEAHGAGIFGQTGAGLCEAMNVSNLVDIHMGTLGKSFGSYGAYISSSSLIIDYLINRARAFMFSTALPPSSVGASLESLRIIRSSPELRNAPLKNSELFRQSLNSSGIGTLHSTTQIVPVIVKDSHSAFELSNYLARSGFYALPIRYPAVPKELPRLRFAINALHTPNDITTLSELIVKWFIENR